MNEFSNMRLDGNVARYDADNHAAQNITWVMVSKMDAC